MRVIKQLLGKQKKHWPTEYSFEEMSSTPCMLIAVSSGPQKTTFVLLVLVSISSLTRRCHETQCTLFEFHVNLQAEPVNWRCQGVSVKILCIVLR